MWRDHFGNTMKIGDIVLLAKLGYGTQYCIGEVVKLYDTNYLRNKPFKARVKFPSKTLGGHYHGVCMCENLVLVKNLMDDALKLAKP